MGRLAIAFAAAGALLAAAPPAQAETRTRADIDAIVGWGIADLEHLRPTTGLASGGRLSVGWCASCIGVFMWGGPYLTYLHVAGDHRDSGDTVAGGILVGIFVGERENEPVFGFRGGFGGGWAWQHIDAPVRLSEEGAAFHYTAELVYQHPFSGSAMAEFALSGAGSFVGGSDTRTDAVGYVGALVGIALRP